MAITLVIHNPRDLDNAITKGFVFCILTLVLMLSALGCAIYLALKRSEGLQEVGPFLLVTSPFILHSFQLLTTLLILRIARKNPENMTMIKCRWWSVMSRILTAPILIEMMILIGFKWYLTVIAIPLVILYFVTILQVEKIMHYFFTRNLSSRIPNRNINHQRELLFFEYPYDIDVNSSFYRLSASNYSPRARPATITRSGNGSSLALSLTLSIPIRNSPPPTYREAMNTTSARVPSTTTNCFRIPLMISPSSDSTSIESPPPAYASLGLDQKPESGTNVNVQGLEEINYNVPVHQNHHHHGSSSGDGTTSQEKTKE